MAAIFRPAWQKANASSQISCAPEARNLGKEVAGSQSMGGFSHHSEEVPILPTAGETSETGPSTSKEQQAADGEALPVEDRSLSRWRISKVEKE